MPGVVGAKVDVKRGDAEVVTADKRTGKDAIRRVVEQTKFKVVTIKGPFEVTR